MRSLEIFFWWGRSLARHDDSRHELCQTVKGSRIWFTGLRTITWDEELLERGETRRSGYTPFPGKGHRFKSGRPHHTLGSEP